MSRSITMAPVAPVTPAPAAARGWRRRWSQVLVCLLALGLIAATVWLVGFSSVLSTRRVVVTGNIELSRSEVRAAADVPVGHPLARQNLEAIAARVASVREVESTTVSRDWPSTIRIAVVERTPVLAVKAPGGYTLIDRFGVAYRSAGALPDGVAVARVGSSDPKVLLDVNRVVQSLPDALAGQVATVVADSPYSIRLVLANSDQIIWGGAALSELKAKVVVPLLSRRATVYDVSAPAHPATR